MLTEQAFSLVRCAAQTNRATLLRTGMKAILGYLLAAFARIRTRFSAVARRFRFAGSPTYSVVTRVFRWDSTHVASGIFCQLFDFRRNDESRQIRGGK